MNRYLAAFAYGQANPSDVLGVRVSAWLGQATLLVLGFLAGYVSAVQAGMG